MDMESSSADDEMMQKRHKAAEKDKRMIRSIQMIDLSMDDPKGSKASEESAVAGDAMMQKRKKGTAADVDEPKRTHHSHTAAAADNATMMK